VPAVRFSRDKRGYEYVYLVHTPTKRGKPGRSRVLYWYRTPPGIRLGRKPFDDEVRRTLERQNPGVVFDWDAIVSTPMPPPDMTEYWRERRRAEKAAKAERRAAEAEESAQAQSEARTAAEAAVDTVLHDQQEAALAQGDLTEHVVAEAPIEVFVEPAGDAGAAADASGQTARKRRRRRGGRRRRQGESGQAAAASGTESADADDLPDADQDEPSDAEDPTSEEQ
jgi:hypothetical protein